MDGKQSFFSTWKRVLIPLAILAIIAVIPGFNAVMYGIVIPYAAVLVFFFGFINRIMGWAKSPVPFRIPATCGQEKSMSWVKNDNLDNPHTFWGVAGRMFLEVFFFRTLFRNTQAGLKDGPKIVYGGNKLLWAAGLAFHWSFLIILIRHVRFFTEPVPGFVNFVQGIDSLFQIGVPVLCLTDIVIVGALSYLFIRRVIFAQVRYISLPADYFALGLLLAVVVTGIVMKYWIKVDNVGAKELAVGLITLSPALPTNPIGFMFYLHIFFVCVLLFYFPFSKLMHMGGIFLSPTRNLANNNRMRRHVNPWNPDVKIHTYEEYEEEFHEVMAAAGMPLDKTYAEAKPSETE